MQRKTKAAIVVSVIGIILIAGILAALNTKDKRTVLKILTDKADLYVRDFHYTEVGDPETTWKIKADSAKYVKNKNIAFLENVEVTLITSAGTTLYLQGQEGRFHTESRNIDVSGNVEVTSDRGEHFTTDSLTYSFLDKKVYTDSIVVMETPGIKVAGKGLYVSLQGRTMTLFDDVTAFIHNFQITP